MFKEQKTSEADFDLKDIYQKILKAQNMMMDQRFSTAKHGSQILFMQNIAALTVL